MLKRIAVIGGLAAAGFGTFAASPALAGDDDPTTVQIIGVQTCRSIDVAGLGAAVHNVLGVTQEQGDCFNGSTVG